MKYRLGVEDIEPGNWVAWVFEWPGCYARGVTREDAVQSVPDAISELSRRLIRAGFLKHTNDSSIETEISEEFLAFKSTPEYIVNAFFEDDKRVLAECDIRYADSLLGLNREELLAVVSQLSDDILNRPISGEVQKNVRGILRHIGTAEWWYWDRLNRAFPREERPEELFELLSKIRKFTLRQLPELAGRELRTVCSGEHWSPRKLLRRTIWHERVHTLQILKYLKILSK